MNPSDWASRRQNAVSRARELRSRIKEPDASDVSSLASKSEIQRLRRSRQLEATQRLLDGQVGGLNNNFSETASSGRSVSSKSYRDEGRRVKGESSSVEPTTPMQRRYNHDKQPVGGRSGSNDGGETHSIISQKHLGQIHKRYHHNPTDDASAETRYSHHRPKEEDYIQSMNEARGTAHASENNKFRHSNSEQQVSQKFRPSPSEPVVQEDMAMIQHSLRDKPIEGRGRGRGRGRSTPGSAASSSLGELSRSSKSHSRPHAVAKDQMADAVIRSRSPAQRVHSTSSRPNQSSHAKDESEATALQMYLSSRRVPDYKEGECEKLRLLRDRLVARRRKRGDKENVQPEVTRTRSEAKEESSRQGDAKNTNGGRSKDLISTSLERLDPNEYSASDFSSKQNRRGHQDSMSSPPRMRREESKDLHSPYNHEHNSMERSPLSYTRNQRVENGMDDDEESVVDIQLTQCECCKRSFAPKVYQKHFDKDGQPKCANNDKKRKQFNSAKARIANNKNLNKDEQMQVLQVNKKVSKEVSKKLSGKGSKRSKKKNSKWREESNQFREAMRANRGL